jgi:ubiquinone/menaquinone biosynthesis C-methylase UbiE
VDIVEKMLQHSWKKANREGINWKDIALSFLAADGRKLPFKSNHFDVLILESVVVFFENKLDLLGELLRVIKPGGYLGLTEMTWLQPPSAEIEEMFTQIAFAKALDDSGWKKLLKSADLENIVGNAYQIDLSQETKGRIERYGRWEILKVIFRMLAATIRDQKYRSLVRQGTDTLSKGMLDMVGYGVYVGQKRSAGTD